MRYSDHPILRPTQDLLGRAGFSLQLARAVDQLAIAEDGFVISIIGEWGAGKTSVLELVIRFLRHIEMERASQEPIFDDRTAVPKSISELEDMSETFELVEKRILSLQEAVEM
jgi:ABC-type dipeptide/oligopeptide/nickel transport system ATPase component